MKNCEARKQKTLNRIVCLVLGVLRDVIDDDDGDDDERAEKYLYDSKLA